MTQDQIFGGTMNNAISIRAGQRDAAPSQNPRRAARVWCILLPVSIVVSMMLGWAWNVPRWFLVLSCCATVLTTTFAAAPYARFFDHGWWTRYDEFRNELWGDALSEYLWHFWHRRAEEAGALLPFEKGKPTAEDGSERVARWKSATAVFDTIYREQYGLSAFVLPLVFLLVAVLLGTHYVMLASMKDILPVQETNVIGFVRTLSPRILALSIGATCGAYLFVVGDCIDSVRKGSLNVADVYWYTLRMLLAVPIASALTFELPTSAATAVAFALGTLPVGFINKQLRRLASAWLKAVPDEEPDQLIKLDGATAPIVALLNAEGVTSIEQLLDMDPVLLSIHTGLPFRLILRFGGQAVVKRHFGEGAFSLSALGLSDAPAVYCLVRELSADDGSGPASKVIDDTCALLQRVSNDPWPQREAVQFSFESIARFAYTHFLMAAGFDRAPREPVSGKQTKTPDVNPEIDSKAEQEVLDISKTTSAV